MIDEGTQAQWRVRVAAGEFGPVDVETLRAWVQQGRVLPQDYVYNPETGAWVMAANVRQLVGAFPPPGYAPGVVPAPPRKGLSTGCIIGLVVGIVVFLMGSVLAGMLLPALARAKETARQAACRNNVRQLGLAIKQYAQEFKDVYPWRNGQDDKDRAWEDVGMLFPRYCSGFGTFICPSSRDRRLEAPYVSGDEEILEPFGYPRGGISYGYCVDARESLVRPWTEHAKSTVRLCADKKAGRAPFDEEEEKKYNHGGWGRNVLYQDGHVEWERGADAVDPDEEDDTVGAPGGRDYRAWWSDPPFSGEETP